MEKFYKRFTCKKWRNFFIGDFHVKLKLSFEFFTRDFPGKKIEWKKFLKGFLWKIEAGEKNLKRFPFKFTPWLVLHVLHFIVDFFYNPRASLARAAFKRDFLVNLREFPSKLSLIPAIDLLPPCSSIARYEGTTPQKLIVKKKVKWSEKWSEAVFGPLNFFIFGYVKGEILANNNIGIKKCTTTFLWVLNLGQVGELPQRFS